MIKLLLCAIICVLLVANVGARTELTDAQLLSIGTKIYINETGGNKNNLLAWNNGEDFMSLGIGHFIWFPEGLDSRFDETFPELITYMDTQGVVLPDWLKSNRDCPWNTQGEYATAADSLQMRQLHELMQSTFTHQVEFIYQRMQNSLSLITDDIADDKSRQRAAETFTNLGSTPLGLYSLIDYVNFKGEGTKHSERYNDEGWGLKQVLLAMNTLDKNMHDAFADACIKVLKRRVENSPQKNIEQKWLNGWIKRCNTYRNEIS